MRTDATVACWGDNTDFRATPRSGTFRQVSAGATHTCGLKTTGAVICWGQGANSAASDPDRVAASDVRQLSAGARHTCGLTVDGTHVCWGDNSDGQTNAPPRTR